MPTYFSFSNSTFLKQEFPNTENNIKTLIEEIVSMSGNGDGDLFLSAS
jgi:hypothetical protein